jgi:N-acetylglutamate synthase/N-acetylornithine aminotransferase
MMTVFYDVEGSAESKRFDDAAPAINFAVRLLQTYNGDLAKIVVRDGDGAIVYTEDDIRNLSRQVRLG